MIEYLKGEVVDLSPTQAIIECNGIGYSCNISVYTYDKLKVGETHKVYIAEKISEDAHELYGFASKQERSLYLLLISVSGVGPGTARCILSSLSPDELVAVIASGNDRQLKNVKGIGSKTAQRIIVDLKDKVGSIDIVAATASDSPIIASNQNGDEAVQALVALGYPMASASKAISQLLSQDPTLSVQTLIKQGLHMM